MAESPNPSIEALNFDGFPAVHLLMDPNVPPGAAFQEAEVSPLTVRLIVHLFFLVNLGFISSYGIA